MLYYCLFSGWDFTKESSPIWNFWTTFRIVVRLVWERKCPNTPVKGILGLQLTSSPPCWMTINKRILISFIVPVIQHGRQGLCHLNLSGMVANQQLINDYHLVIFPWYAVVVNLNITLLYIFFLRYNLPVPQEETMKASVVEARLRTKLRESFQVRKRRQTKDI